MLKQKYKPVLGVLLFLTSILGSNLLILVKADALVRDIVFPVIGEASFVNDFYYRRGERQHNATDVMAAKGRKLVAVAQGTIVDVQYPQPRWGYSITIEDDDGFQYSYLHMNDDTPGTNDGKGGAMNAYAPDMQVGNRVKRGQLIGWVGDSGHANGVPHLHFEMYAPNGKVLNPYNSLTYSTRISKPKIPGRVTAEILPFGQYYDGPANVAMGNLDLDPASEFVVSAGQGADPHIRVYDDNQTLIKKFLAFGLSFEGGVDVALGDVDADGVDEIIAAAGPGSSRIRVFEADSTEIENFYAYTPDVKNGLKIATGDINGDLRDEIIVGLGAGSQPKVKIFDLAGGNPVLLREFLAFSSSFTGGVDVSAGDVDPVSLFDEIVVGAGAGGDPKVRVFAADGPRLQEFMAYLDTMRGGVRVSVGNVRTDSVESEIATIPASKGNPQVNLFKGDTTLLWANMFMERWWVGSYDIAAGFDTSKALAGTNRRVTVRLGIE
jgi:hypothetical protein